MQPGVDFIGVNIGFICHDGKGRVLLHKRSDKCRDEHNTWDNGGGRVKFGETLEQAVVREVREEYGCEPKNVQHVAQRTFIREHDGHKTHWLVNVYVVLVDATEAKIMEPDKNLGNQWCTLDALPEPLHSGAKVWFTEYRKDLEALMHSS
jgi:8-oxo-dGTP diphosphatase